MANTTNMFVAKCAEYAWFTSWHFDVPTSNVKIVAGFTSRKKIVEIIK